MGLLCLTFGAILLLAAPANADPRYDCKYLLTLNTTVVSQDYAVALYYAYSHYDELYSKQQSGNTGSNDLGVDLPEIIKLDLKGATSASDFKERLEKKFSTLKQTLTSKQKSYLWPSYINPDNASQFVQCMNGAYLK